MGIDYETLLDAIRDLKQHGFSHDFYLDKNGLYSPTLQQQFHPDEITIVNYYRFEGMSYPGDNDILYVLETNRGDKGILICPYGVYADTATLIPKLRLERQPDFNKYNVTST